MKKLVAIILLSFWGNAAHAEWVRVYASNGDVIYVDPATKRRSGAIARIWTMYDKSEAQVVSGKAHSSFKIFSQYNCEDELSRAVIGIFYTGRMGSGVVVGQFDEPNADWRSIVPDTNDKYVLNFACRR